MPEVQSVLDALVDLSHYLGDPARDLAILGEGNTSARMDDDTFFVKASGANLGTIREAGFCRVGFGEILAAYDGHDLSDDDVRVLLSRCVRDRSDEVLPSVETFLHAYLLTLADAAFVGHTHPVAVNAILCSRDARAAIAGRLFPDEIVCCGIAPCFVEYTDPGVPLARRLKLRVEEYQSEYGRRPKTILMQNHGLIAVGRTATDVMAITDMCVKAARILLGTYAVGGPHYLTPDNVKRIDRRPDEHYRQRVLGQRA